MSRFNTLFNVDTDQIKTRSFTYRGQSFRVRIPTLGQIDAFEEHLKLAKNDAAKIDAIYQKRKEGLLPSDQIVFTQDDVLIEGKSLREQANNQYISELRITWLFNLLVKVVDDGGGDLTYEQIASELPMQLQSEIVDRISKAMVPDSEETKKNSSAAAPANSGSTSKPTEVIQTP